MNFDMDEIYDHQRREREELLKLRAEPCLTPIVVGDRVLVASGLLGMGHLWIRREGTVLECAATAYKVDLGKACGIHWVHQDLITDVLGQAKEPTP